jgi:hypothetical protein
MLTPQGEQEGAERIMQSRRPWKRRRFWKRSLEEPSGVGGAECWDSRQGNKGDLTESRVHSSRKVWYKHVMAKSGPELREKSEGDTVPPMVRTTQPHRREGPLLQPLSSGE